MKKSIFFAVVLFAAMTIQTGRMTLILVALALALCIGRTPWRQFGRNLSLPVLGFLIFALMSGLAAVYSPFGAPAAAAFSKALAAFSVAVIVLVRLRREDIPGLLWATTAVCAAISLICIDYAGAGGLANGFFALMERLGAEYTLANGAVDAGVRVNGIYNDANVTASLFALGSLLGLHLARTAPSQRKWVQPAAFVLLGINAMGFFLALSRGAILCFALALVVYLLAVGKGRRLPLFVLMAEIAVVTMVLSAVVMPSLGTSSPLPDVLTLVCGALVWPLDRFVGQPLAGKLQGHGKAIAAAACGLVVLCGIYGVAAMRISGEFTFPPSGRYYRTTQLTAGDYTLNVDGTGSLGVTVYAYNHDNVLMHQYDLRYEGDAAGAAFTVPEGTQSVGVYVWGQPGETLRSVTLSDGTALHLGYPLLPEFVATRLQDNLLTSYSTVMRLQYMKDGWKLFTQSPLIGHGLASTEGLLTTVQPVYYESLYVHNHLLQYLDDMGLLGLAAFLTMMLGAVYLLARQLRAQSDGLAAVLLACLAMMNFHGLMELTFSIRAFQCVAFALVMAVVVSYAEPQPRKGAKALAVVAMVFLCGYLAVFGALLESRRMVQREAERFQTTNPNEFMETLERHIARDVFDHEQNQLTYVANAVQLDNSRYNGVMRKYAEELRRSGTYYACSGLAAHYDLPRGDLAALFSDSRRAIAQKASSAEAWNLQMTFYRDTVLPALSSEQLAEFVVGVLETRDYLTAYNEGRLQPIALNEDNEAFLTLVTGIAEAGQADESAYAALLPFLQEAS